VASFQDAGGNTWEIVLDVNAAKRVRDHLDLSLFDLLDPKKFGPWAQDIIRVVDTIYVIVKPQADGKGITDEQFGALMLGPAIDKAIDAFVEAIRVFLKGRRGGEAAAEAFGILQKSMDKIESRMTEEMPDLMQKLEKAVDAQLEKVFGSGSTATPESSE